MHTILVIFLLLCIGLSILSACTKLPLPVPLRSLARDRLVAEWFRNSQKHPDWAITPNSRCGDAPFSFPTQGFIGYIWDDSFRPGHRHQGLDIFSRLEPGEAPVYAAYAGYLTRLADWKSSVIVRIPEDPLFPGRQIWTYYTHMADPSGDISYISAEFPPGTKEKYVEAGTLLGYQGNYSGVADTPVGVHLHFSIVKDNGNGLYLNELDINNTLDPSEYFGLPLNANSNTNTIPVCAEATEPLAPE